MSQTKSQLFDTSVNGPAALKTGAHNATLDASGNLNIGTGNLIVANGKGIDFSATSGSGTSELLDDYEEGTWTPTYAGATTAGSFTYGDNIGVYTKIGRSVFVTLRLVNITEVSAANGSVVIAGLPFASDASMTGGNMRLDQFNLSSDVYQVAFIVSSSASNLNIYQSKDNSGDTALGVDARTGDGADIIGSFTYNTTT